MADLSGAFRPRPAAKRLLHDVARSKCLRRFNYDPTSYVNESARERHIEIDAQSTANGPEFRATTADVLRRAAGHMRMCDDDRVNLRALADEIDPKEGAAETCPDCGLPNDDEPARRDERHDHCGPLPHTGPIGGPYCERCE